MLSLMDWLLMHRLEDVDVTNGQGYSALHIAAKRQDSEMVGLLLKYGADRSQCTNHGKKALNYVSPRSEIYQLLSGEIMEPRNTMTSQSSSNRSSWRSEVFSKQRTPNINFLGQRAVATNMVAKKQSKADVETAPDSNSSYLI